MSEFAAPMSFSGSLSRVGRWPSPVRWTIGYWIVLPAWWFLILVWYATFGVLVVPWRLIRRGERRDKALRKTLEQTKNDGGGVGGT